MICVLYFICSFFWSLWCQDFPFKSLVSLTVSEGLLFFFLLIKKKRKKKGKTDKATFGSFEFHQNWEQLWCSTIAGKSLRSCSWSLVMGLSHWPHGNHVSAMLVHGMCNWVLQGFYHSFLHSDNKNKMILIIIFIFCFSYQFPVKHYRYVFLVLFSAAQIYS